jgi:hypothetical protein
MRYCARCGEETAAENLCLCPECWPELSHIMDDEGSRKFFYAISDITGSSPTQEEIEEVFHNNNKLISIVVDGLREHPLLPKVLRRLGDFD